MRAVLAFGFIFLFAWISSVPALAQTAPAHYLDGYHALAYVRSLLAASPYRMSATARAGTIRYRIQVSEAGTSWHWPETGEQHVERQTDAVVLTICSTCGRESPPTASVLKAAMQPNRWLQSEDPTIRHFARVAYAGTVDARMHRLVDAVKRRMSGPIDYGAYLDARAALSAKSGDCTEYAVLLAAAARARGISTRVVTGLAYGSRFAGQPHVFTPHMWVQAWDGERWTSYDAGLGAFDAGHIALVVGDGSPESMRGAMALIRTLRIVDANGILKSSG